jgi:hypothetical protein
MAITNCNRCDRFIDTDDGGYETDPDELGKFICSDCEARIQERETEADDVSSARRFLTSCFILGSKLTKET